jgi:hypothetical protein
MLTFKCMPLVSGQSAREWGLYVVDGGFGNDAGLLTVFDNPATPKELAGFFNWAYDQYLRSAPMQPAR